MKTCRIIYGVPLTFHTSELEKADLLVEHEGFQPISHVEAQHLRGLIGDRWMGHVY